VVRAIAGVTALAVARSCVLSRNFWSWPQAWPQRLERTLVSIGRDGEIRTRDPLHPMQVRYQAAPRPDLNRDATHRDILRQLATVNH
jgi:hypothetical protein